MCINFLKFLQFDEVHIKTREDYKKLLDGKFKHAVSQSSISVRFANLKRWSSVHLFTSKPLMKQPVRSQYRGEALSLLII